MIRGLHRFRFALMPALCCWLFANGAQPVQATAIPKICGARADIIGLLAQNFGERLQTNIRYRHDRTARVYASAKGSWSVVKSTEDGLDCILAAGSDMTSSAELIVDAGV